MSSKSHRCRLCDSKMHWDEVSPTETTYLCTAHFLRPYGNCYSNAYSSLEAWNEANDPTRKESTQ